MKFRHYDHDGRARFITFAISHRVPILTNDLFRRALAQSISAMRSKYRLRLLGYVFMPEHVHLMVVPPEEVKLGPVVGLIKRYSSRSIHEHLKQAGSTIERRFLVHRNARIEFALWQRRCFDHNCRSLESVCRKIEYCHYNPVLRGLVAEPGDWRWSSYRAYQGERDVPLPMDEFAFGDDMEAKGEKE
jgi:putative transposase